MSTATYTTRFSELNFSSHPAGDLSGPSVQIPSYAIIKGVYLRVYCGVSTFNYDADTCFTLTDGSGKTLSIESTCNTGGSNRVWAEFGGTPAGSIDWNDLESISLYGTNKLTVRPEYDATLTIEYEEFTACGAPTVCSLSKTISSGESVALSWSGATAGTGNAVTGYEVQVAISQNGSTWSAWVALTVTTATTMLVDPPETPGHYFKFRVRTRGAAGSAYYSAWKASANTLRRDHATLEGFTDSPLMPGVTPVKALHMLELQERVNTLRAFYGLSAYNFSPIDARSIAGWTAHVKEIRNALDEIGKEHEAWLDIPVNRPRADVIEQLRAVVLAT